MTRLTPRQGAIIGAYTGYLCGSFPDMHQYIEELMGRPVMTHEIPDLMPKISALALADFKAIAALAEQENDR